MKKFLLTSIYLLIFNFTFAQEEELNSELTDFIESMMEDENNKIEYEELEERFLLKSDSKISLNTANVNELAQIPTLTESDIQNILIHRKKYGYFQTLYELKNIPNMTFEKIQKTLPFISIESKEKTFQWKDEWKTMKHTFCALYQQSLQLKEGYRKDSVGNSKYAGPPMRYYAKYQLKTSNKIMAGYLLEKDPGEVVWDNRFKGSDYHSAYVQLNNFWKFKNINIGDYKASFGQGLVIGTSSIFGKSSSAVQTFAQREGIYKYSSTNESYAFRGIGTTFTNKEWDFSFFFSSRKKDATTNEGFITSFKTDGLHRTKAEIEKKNNIRECVIGGNISFRKNGLQLGATLLYYKYSDTLLPTEKAYNHHKLKMKDHHLNAGINYKYFFRKINFFGEAAIDANCGLALLNGIAIYPNSIVTLLALHRIYQPEYQANFANAFGENSKNENERGFYIGAKILPVKKIVLSLYADVFKFPWLKYNIDSPSHGEEFLCNLQYNTNRYLNMILRYKYKDYIEQCYTKQSLRYVFRWDKRRLKSQTLIEASKVEKNDETTFGWVIAQDISHQWQKPRLNLNMHYAFFCAENYNNRFYLYERDVFNTFSMPMLYGKGHRIGLNLKWELGNHLQIYANYSTYLYTDGREKCGNGTEMIKGGISSLAKILVRVWF